MELYVSENSESRFYKEVKVWILRLGSVRLNMVLRRCEEGAGD
jgi:hypothetical protein